ncbi:RES family NAD+ phosphorylase [Neptunomonas sp.]|uniref:RES family NAD+ phosphorylase n=1 Tax=Neptunomonas sp. TaxID=1971898 RepID=UPI0025D57C5C|nr:RES family NAD+ phosphorylase [Neptunomonas sp.]
MVNIEQLPALPSKKIKSYRLINSKFPPISLFDDVADANEFNSLYALQTLTNPRLKNEVGDLQLIPRTEIPFGIPGCSYATAPFTHVNPDGSRFSNGAFGILYLADSMETAIAEVKHHQHAYWSRVPELNYERFVFRGLICHFDEVDILDGLTLSSTNPIYSPTDYSEARVLGHAIKHNKSMGIRYHSVRRQSAICWALMTPSHVTSIQQATHYEMVWNGSITGVNKLSSTL